MRLQLRCPNTACGRYLAVDEDRLGGHHPCPACRSPLSVQAPFGREGLDGLIRYQLLKKLGQGGMSFVYEAIDHLLGYHVAVKVPNERTAWGQESIHRFLREVDILKRLSHSNICSLLDAGDHEGVPFFTMILLGTDLGHRLKREGAFSPRDAAELLRSVARSLEHAHGLGVLHRDLKPSNILLGKDGKPYVSDFGLGLLMNQPSMTAPGKIVGTRRYVAPERLEDRRDKIDQRSDIYSLGIILFELLAGENPFRDVPDDLLWDAVLAGLAVAPSSRRPDGNTALDEVVARATATNPDDRYKDMAELAVDLESFLGVVPPGSTIFIEPAQPTDPSPVPILVSSKGIQLARIPAGTFQMGAEDGDANERPIRLTTISRDFLLGIYPVTQGQFLQLIDDGKPFFRQSPPHPDDDRRPMDAANWLRAILFCNMLSAQEGLPLYYRLEKVLVTQLGGPGYRLPTEAEWEYACRAGCADAFCFGPNDHELHRFAWYELNSEKQTWPVGKLSPNRFGLYDMLGNVREWCWDWFAEYRPAETIDPKGPATGHRRVLRGGSFLDDALSLRSTARKSWEPVDMLWSAWDQGFRVARNLAT
jgi:serine/threonine protein kinase